MPPFVGLRHFHQGRNFKQWTGDDSRALMKIWLAAIKGLVPHELVRMTHEYLEFAYRIWHPIQTDTKIKECETHLTAYHRHREFLRDAGVRPDGFSIPRQHSHGHMPRHTWNFGALYGLCTSLTENKHIKAVKEPWRRSNRYHALGQMLLTNQRLDKLAAARVDFTARGMLDGTALSEALAASMPVFLASPRSPVADAFPDDLDDLDHPLQGPPLMPEPVPQANPGAASGPDGHRNGPGAHGIDEPQIADADGGNGGAEPEVDDDDEEGIVEGPPIEAFVVLARQRAKGYPRKLVELSTHIERPELTTCIAQFLAKQLHEDPDDEAVLAAYSIPNMRISVFPSAVATFFAPADPSGTGGMRRERIRATPSWRNGGARYDCAYVEKDATQDGFRGLSVVRVRLFFSFKFNGILYPCALVEWFEPVGDEPDEETGMWIVEPELDIDAERPCEVIHLDTIFRAAHLLPVFVSKFIDYHGHEHLF
ncbi:hypothetical protein EVJ58_g533 [Rhodofomes roseus]|uniref:Uncharacterized protein n=1 Tax=Rhodofomes roseus TaxID=34475 RepID=A0A4Y9Z626_9APHY|nr:hypothetical protein EVJ58_g533 [Rhodofomes roseus]